MIKSDEMTSPGRMVSLIVAIFVSCQSLLRTAAAVRVVTVVEACHVEARDSRIGHVAAREDSHRLSGRAACDGPDVLPRAKYPDKFLGGDVGRRICRRLVPQGAEQSSVNKLGRLVGSWRRATY